MARIFGIVLMLFAIWYGISVYSGDDGQDRAEPESASQLGSYSEGEASEPPRDFEASSGRAAPNAVTSRVRERVNSAVAEGYRSHTGE